MKNESNLRNHLNSVLVEGNMMHDPRTHHTITGRLACNFRMSSSRYYKDSGSLAKEVSYFDIEAWGTLGESVYAKGRKGRGCRVVGRLRQDRWDGEDGRKHSRLVIVADHIEYSDNNQGAAAEHTDEEIAGYSDIPPVEQGIEEPLEVVA